MRTFTKLIASSVGFNATSPSSGILAAATTSQFGTQGAFGGPIQIEFTRGFTMQFNFGGNGNASSGAYGGQLNVLVSNVLEKPLFVVAASAQVSSTGSVMFNSVYSNYSFIDFQFIPSITCTSGFFSAVLTSKAGGT